MATDKQEKYLKNRDTYPVSDDVKRQYDFRIREKAKKMLDDLTTMAQYLPEDQLAQVFTKEKIQDLIHFALNSKATYADNPKYGTEHILNSRAFDLGYHLVFAGLDTAYDNVHPKDRAMALDNLTGAVDPVKKLTFIINMKKWMSRDVNLASDWSEFYPFQKDPKKLKG